MSLFPFSNLEGLSLDAIPHQIWIADVHGQHLYANKQWYDYTGLTAEEMENHRWQSVLHPQDQAAIKQAWQDALATGAEMQSDVRLKRHDGVYRWHTIRATAQYNAKDENWLWVGTCTDIHEHKRMEEALQESELRFRRLMESNIIGITIADADGTIHEANEAFLSLVGYTREDLMAGKVRWTAMTPVEYQERYAQAIEEILDTGMFRPYEKEYIRKDGSRVPIMVCGALFRLLEGSTPQSVILTQDLTARKEVERQKDFFLAMTGHELKTPLTALKGALQLLQRRVTHLNIRTEIPLSEIHAFLENCSERLATAIRRIDTQTHVINDLLDVSCIATNTLHLEQETCDLVALVRETIANLRLIAPSRSFLLAVPNHLTLLVFVDRDRIGQVVQNYVTNALRYAPADQPIQIGLSAQEQSARVWVQDRGPGLTTEEQEEVWQRFRQGKGGMARSGPEKGLGLGLYLCQMLITAHQGQVGVESTPGEGSTFWFTLPLVYQREQPLLEL